MNIEQMLKEFATYKIDVEEKVKVVLTYIQNIFKSFVLI